MTPFGRLGVQGPWPGGDDLAENEACNPATVALADLVCRRGQVHTPSGTLDGGRLHREDAIGEADRSE